MRRSNIHFQLDYSYLILYFGNEPMNICLIRPQEAISLDSASANKPILPLGLAYLASALLKNNFNVQVIDSVGLAPDKYESFFNDKVRLLGLGQDEIIKKIEGEPLFIGVSIMFSHNWPHVRELLKKIKKKFPGTPLVLGGEFATALPDICLKETPIDILATGEGEETIVELAKALSSRSHELSGITGIRFRQGNEIIINPKRDRIINVDEIPLPAWHLFNINVYKKHQFESGFRIEDAQAIMPMLATRGCPYQCTFCTSPNMWTTRYVTRTPSLVVDELEYNIKHYDVTNFPFQDLTAIIQKKWIVEFCNEIIKRDLKISWQLPSGTRSEVIDNEVADLLYRSGMKEMGYAPESGSDAIRKHIKKKVKADKLYDSVRSAIKYDLKVQVFFIVGFPNETRKDVMKTLHMVAKMAWMGVQDVGMNHYMPLPGTEQMEKEMESDWAKKLGDKFYMIPLFGHSLKMENWRKANARFSSFELTLYVMFGFMMFYSVSFLRHPSKFFQFIGGLRSKTDTSRVQLAIKTMLRHRKNVAGA
jgi:anaerobic magnesium-protoporphyrin IX monomethyl ester cyclase